MVAEGRGQIEYGTVVAYGSAAAASTWNPTASVLSSRTSLDFPMPGGATSSTARSSPAAGRRERLVEQVELGLAADHRNRVDLRSLATSERLADVVRHHGALLALHEHGLAIRGIGGARPIEHVGGCEQLTRPPRGL